MGTKLFFSDQPPSLSPLAEKIKYGMGARGHTLSSLHPTPPRAAPFHCQVNRHVFAERFTELKSEEEIVKNAKILGTASAPTFFRQAPTEIQTKIAAYTADPSIHTLKQATAVAQRLLKK